jgi:hypothetical protein
MSTTSRRLFTLASTCCLWSSSHKSCGVNCFSKQSAIVLADEILFLNFFNYCIFTIYSTYLKRVISKGMDVNI